MVWHFIKCLGEIKYNGVCMVVSVQVVCNLLSGDIQLCLTRPATSETMLRINQYTVGDQFGG